MMTSKVKVGNKGTTELSIDSESEYFFDDQFIIPFDANLKEENNNYSSNDIGIEDNGSNFNRIQSLCQSYSESCIYSDLDSSYHQFPDILDELFDGRKPKGSLFTPSQSNSEVEARDSMHRSSLMHSSILKELLNKQSGRDYRITFEEKSNCKLNNKTNSLINCYNEYDGNDNSVDNKMTWNQISNKNRSSLLKLNASNDNNDTKTQSTTWKQLKDNASKKLISWNKLKGANDCGEDESQPNTKVNNQRGRSIVKSNNMLNEKSTSLIKFRAHSEPRRSYRFSGTLLEIFSRTRGLNQIRNSEDSFDIFKYGNDMINDKSKVLINFGAQFPPTNNMEYQYRNRSNSLLDRRSQKYPGLGVINTPKYLRLTDTVFLSKTLPDLSFLAKDSEDITSNNRNSKRLKTKIYSKELRLDYSRNNAETLKDSHMFCKKCQTVYSDAPVTDDLINLNDTDISNFNQYRSVPNFKKIDLLTGSPRMVKTRHQNEGTENPLKSCLRQSLDRSFSEPDFGNSKSEKNRDYDDESNTDSASDQECNKSNKAKKSVSFNEKILKTPLSPLKCYGSSLDDLNQNMFNKPQAIPRDLGLYGNESVMISEFSLGAQLRCSKENELSNEDLKFKVMIRDIIIAVQETIAVCSEQFKENKNSIEKRTIRPCLCVVQPLYTLLTDGILPYQKNAMSFKSRNRIWSVIESSCNNADYMTEILKSLKKISITNDKNRFNTFISNLMNEKLLKKWFKDLIKNESLLKNHYSKESFLRQCKTNLKGLYADLETNLQLLDNLPYGSSGRIEQTNQFSKDRLIISKPITSVKSLKKSNSGINSSRLQESSGTQFNVKDSSNVKINRPNSSSKSFNNLSTSSTTSSTSNLKKPVIYYPKCTIGKGKN